MNKIANVETEVLKRYSDAAEARVPALCCPVEYDARYLAAIPAEVLERDYGCGDPSKFVREGDTVLDLGSGGGKICFIAAQIAGPGGQVIGVDFNPAMLDLARRHAPAVAKAIGWENVSFRRGKIQDLRTDYDRIENDLKSSALSTLDQYLDFEGEKRERAQREPMINDASVDVILSNCVLNLVRDEDKQTLFLEMHRVLKRGGRVAISDIVADETPTAAIRQDADLWSGCIAGAFQEHDFLKAFEAAGFYGIAIEKRDEKPWAVVQGIEFRSITITAYKGKEGPCLERNQAVIYKGPWRQVSDDDGHVFRRGQATAVCDKTFGILTGAPYAEEMVAVPPRIEIPLSEAKDFDCMRSAPRHPRETKGVDFVETKLNEGGDGASCCR
jgi:SAM-dependent methyltransferase